MSDGGCDLSNNNEECGALRAGVNGEELSPPFSMFHLYPFRPYWLLVEPVTRGLPGGCLAVRSSTYIKQAKQVYIDPVRLL